MQEERNAKKQQKARKCETGNENGKTKKWKTEGVCDELL